MQLYNTLSAEERAVLLDKAKKKRLTLSFYQYAKIGNPELFRNHLFLAWDELKVLGRIYVAHEGINAQLSVPEENFEVFKNFLDNIDFLEGVHLNIAIEQATKSFLKLKVKVRPKIVADGLDDATFDVTQKGEHLNAHQFNQLLDHPDTVCLDMRNHYESEIGHFKNALTPDVDTFRESLPLIEKELEAHKKDKNLLMYCTGGIRCEKASAYFKHKGFQHVFQMKGGIIEYARQAQENDLDNKFIGKNFVFDNRLGERISDEIIARCHQCGKPCDSHTNCANEACHLLFIQCEECAEKMEGCCSEQCQQIHNLPIEEQKQLRKGRKNSNKHYRKGRSKSLKYKN